MPTTGPDPSRPARRLGRFVGKAAAGIICQNELLQKPVPPGCAAVRIWCPRRRSTSHWWCQHPVPAAGGLLASAVVDVVGKQLRTFYVQFPVNKLLIKRLRKIIDFLHLQLDDVN